MLHGKRAEGAHRVPALTILSSALVVHDALCYKGKTRSAQAAQCRESRKDSLTHCFHSTCPQDRGLQSQRRRASILQQDSMHCKARTSPRT